MNDADRRYLAAALERVERVLNAKPAPRLHPQGLSPELQAFGEGLDRLLDQLAAMRELALALSNGDLGHEPPPRTHLLDPLKQLRSNLRHLTWQAQQIAAGDLDQRVDYLGDFSDAFNRMIQGLRDKRVAEARVRYLSLHDALTGLRNRAFFNDELERLAAAGQGPISLLVADVDGLKQVNDTAGHLTGDLLIQKAARVLERGARAEDVVVRLGGDEFVIILYRTDNVAAGTVLARVREALIDSNRRDAGLPLSLSVGIATASDGSLLEEAFARADAAMYREKLAKQGRCRSGSAVLGLSC
ncbi:diguanylate cyclase domain-containing protein [Thiococcus pfennigii]|uniref:diguanylate cyclase domain-containing protein n=1 Tax=Thiococcus pfennigii TaxID=1057 RepID=UPI00190378C3|nr:hypothetical protein [Thiococcus pfennigii]MBK1733182.1 hypothetical protein [Thiococcus pfennigii]